MDDDEPLFMVMVLVHDDGAEGVSIWKAAYVVDLGFALTREQAEAVVADEGAGARFLYPYDDDTAYLGPSGGGSAPPLTMPPGHTLWDYGEPARVDLVEVLRSAYATTGSTPPPPDIGNASIEVAVVLEIASAWFGAGDPHRVEAAFDLLAMELGGNRHGDPPFYGVPLEALGLD